MSRELFEDLLEGRVGVWEYLKAAATYIFRLPPMKLYNEPIQVEVGDDGLPCIVTVEATPRLASGDHPRG